MTAHDDFMKSAAKTFRTGVVFDMRSPATGGPPPELFDEVFDMIEFADKHGLGCVNFPEHHAAEDGYVPTPALMAAGAATRTKKIGIVAGAIVLPLHDPVSVAEQIAVLDLMSNGRYWAVLAAGYSKKEFKSFGKSTHDRAKLMDENVEIITRALSGETFAFGDREVCVRPLPKSNPPKVLIGGGVDATAKRAARFGLGMWTLNAANIPVYEAECKRLGRVPGPVMPPTTAVHVAEDPDKAWEEIAHGVIYNAQSYAALLSDDAPATSPFHGLTSAEAVKKSGLIQIVTPEECIELAKRSGPVKIHPLMGGISTKVGWKNLELFATKVVPALNAL